MLGTMKWLLDVRIKPPKLSYFVVSRLLSKSGQHAFMMLFLAQTCLGFPMFFKLHSRIRLENMVEATVMWRSMPGVFGGISTFENTYALHI